MRALAILSLMVCAGCFGPGDGHDDGDPDPGPVEIKCPEEAEICGYRDGGWDAFCEAGVVKLRSLNTTLYCAPPATEILCEVGDPTPRAAHTCATACNGMTKYLETVDEYNAFDPATLCQ